MEGGTEEREKRVKTGRRREGEEKLYEGAEKQAKQRWSGGERLRMERKMGRDEGMGGKETERWRRKEKVR